MQSGTHSPRSPVRAVPRSVGNQSDDRPGVFVFGHRRAMCAVMLRESAAGCSNSRQSGMTDTGCRSQTTASGAHRTTAENARPTAHSADTPALRPVADMFAQQILIALEKTERILQIRPAAKITRSLGVLRISDAGTNPRCRSSAVRYRPPAPPNRPSADRSPGRAAGTHPPPRPARQSPALVADQRLFGKIGWSSQHRNARFGKQQIMQGRITEHKPKSIGPSATGGASRIGQLIQQHNRPLGAPTASVPPHPPLHTGRLDIRRHHRKRRLAPLAAATALPPPH